MSLSGAIGAGAGSGARARARPGRAPSVALPAAWYAALRATLGAYLCVHFVQLGPWAVELFSRDGMLPADASPLMGVIPNVLGLGDAPWMAVALVGLGAVASVALAAGLKDRLAALVLWYVWACLFGRNPLISNPSLPYVGLLLLTHAAAPLVAAPGERGLPRRLYAVLWILMAVGYGYSGLTKLVSPSWIDGTAVAHVLDNPLARDTALRAWLTALPDALLKLATWGTLALELAFAPLALSRRARPWIWGAMVGLHLSLLVLIDFADLTLGMLLLHAFTFDPRWLARTGLRRQT